MDVYLSPEQLHLRAEVRAFLDENYPPEHIVQMERDEEYPDEAIEEALKQVREV